eukprot:g1743.t1
MSSPAPKCYLGGTAADWVAYAVAIPIMLLASSGFAFGTYENALRCQLDYDDSELSVLYACLSTGLYLCAVPAGSLLRSRGRAVALSVGGVLAALGYFLAWAALSDRHDENGIRKYPTSVGFMCFVFFIIGSGCVVAYLAALSTFLPFEAQSKGTLVGILACVYGCGPLFFGNVFGSYYEKNLPSGNQDIVGFLLFVSVFFLVVFGVGVLTMQCASAACADCGGGGEGERRADAGTELVAAVDGESAPYVAVEDDGNGSDAPAPPSPPQQLQQLQQPLSGAAPTDIHGARTLLLRQDFQLLALSFAHVMGGAGFIWVSNLGILSRTLGHSDHTAVQLITTWSVCGLLARVIFGVLANSLMRTSLWVLINASFTVFYALFQIAMDSTALLFICTGVFGAMFGGIWAIAPLITQHQYGAAHFGQNFGMVITGSCVITWFYFGIQSSTYGAHAHTCGTAPTDDTDCNLCFGTNATSAPPGSYGHQKVCRGTECVRTTTLIIMAFCVVTTAMSVRMRKVFRDPNKGKVEGGWLQRVLNA